MESAWSIPAISRLLEVERDATEVGLNVEAREVETDR